MARFISALLIAFVGFAAALPLEQSATSDAIDFQHPSYNTEGLPSNIFPDYTGYEMEQTEPLKDGLVYLNDQGSGKKMAN
ncbi:unnamed protein product [Rhizopus stolonifer]